LHTLRANGSLAGERQPGGRTAAGRAPPVDSRTTDRNLHIVVPTIGRPTCASVVREALRRERRLTRLTVVSQGCESRLDDGHRRDAERRGVVLTEIALPAAVGPAQARHLGALEGDEEFVGFLDDDITFVRGALSSLVERCERDGLGGACGVLVVPEAGPAGRAVKALLFWSIFRDRRQWAAWATRPVSSAILSGGMTVYRRSLYLHCAPAWTSFVPSGYGEDVELSFSVSRLADLVVDPAVRVDNAQRQQSTGPADPTARALQHLERYRSFAARHATTRAHWLAYGGVLAGILGRGLDQGAGPAFVRAVLGEAVRTAGRVVLPPTAPAWTAPMPPSAPEAASATVGAVVVFFHSEDTVLDCVRSLRAQTRPPDAIVVVTNSPVAGPLREELAAAGVRIVDMPTNVGFASACNAAVALVQDLDFAWFVNPDVACEPFCLERLLAAAATRGRAALAPTIVDQAGRTETSAKTRLYLTPWVLLARELGIGRRLNLGATAAPASPVHAVSAACLLVPLPAFTVLGGFDERYFLYGEDVDLCLRLGDAGIETAIVPGAVAVHEAGRGSGRSPAPGVRAIKGREARRAHYLLLQRFRSPRAAERYRRGLVWVLRARMAVARHRPGLEGVWEQDRAAYEWARDRGRGVSG
jgi:N-acetylglucosaminyl-diphospho-decaprenol L-rhamnosyltransferase